MGREPQYYTQNFLQAWRRTMASLIIGEEDGGQMCIFCTTHTYTPVRGAGEA